MGATKSYYLNSDDVTIFPSTRRATTYVKSKLMSEASVVNIINKLVDKDSFVITGDHDVDSTSPYADNTFEFNVHGYYFSISKASLLFDLATGKNKIYANIIVDESLDFPELVGIDTTEETTPTEETVYYYSGLHITLDNTLKSSKNGTVYSLQLFERYQGSPADWDVPKYKEEKGWIVPASSRIKFNQYSLNLNIDGGEI
jgi:hypothetical protein